MTPEENPDHAFKRTTVSKIAAHFKFALDKAFVTLGYEYALLVESEAFLCVSRLPQTCSYWL